MPGQFKESAISFFVIFLEFYVHIFFRIQEEYSREFTTFKPDKKLRWLSHLGTVSLEIALEDRTVEAEVPPLEAAFIELFSQKGAVIFFNPSFY